MMRYYVLLMPSGHMIARHEHSEVLPDEADAVDCWIITTWGGEQAAIAKAVLNMYNQLRVKCGLERVP